MTHQKNEERDKEIRIIGLRKRFCTIRFTLNNREEMRRLKSLRGDFFLFAAQE